MKLYRIVARMRWTTRDGYTSSDGLPEFYMEAPTVDAARDNAVLLLVLSNPHRQYSVAAACPETGEYATMSWTEPALVPRWQGFPRTGSRGESKGYCAAKDTKTCLHYHRTLSGADACAKKLNQKES